MWWQYQCVKKNPHITTPAGCAAALQRALCSSASLHQVSELPLSVTISWQGGSSAYCCKTIQGNLQRIAKCWKLRWKVRKIFLSLESENFCVEGWHWLIRMLMAGSATGGNLGCHPSVVALKRQVLSWA